MAEPKFTDDGKIADIAKRIMEAEKELEKARCELNDGRSTENGLSCKLANLRIEFTRASAKLIDRTTLDQAAPRATLSQDG